MNDDDNDHYKYTSEEVMSNNS